LRALSPSHPLYDKHTTHHFDVPMSGSAGELAATAVSTAGCNSTSTDDTGDCDRAIALLQSAAGAEQLAGAKWCRAWLSINGKARLNKRTHQLVDAGVVRHLVRVLGTTTTTTKDTSTTPPCNELVFEALWALTNVAANKSAYTVAVVAGGALPPVVQLCSSPVRDVSDQAVWCLGNICGDSAAMRDLVMAVPGLVETLAGVVNACSPDTDPKREENAAWTIANLWRFDKMPQEWLARTAPLVPWLVRTLVQSKCGDTLKMSCWALYYLCRHKDGSLLKILADCGATSAVVALVARHARRTDGGGEDAGDRLLRIALRTLNCLSASDRAQAKVAVDDDALVILHAPLAHANQAIVRAACGVVQSLCLADEEVFDCVGNAGLVPLILTLAESADDETCREAVGALRNLCVAKPAHSFLIDSDALPVISRSLSHRSEAVVALALQALTMLLSAAAEEAAKGATTAAAAAPRSENKVASMMEECGGLDALEALQRHRSDATARLLLETYFFGDEGALGLRPHDPEMQMLDCQTAGVEQQQLGQNRAELLDSSVSSARSEVEQLRQLALNSAREAEEARQAARAARAELESVYAHLAQIIAASSVRAPAAAFAAGADGGAGTSKSAC
jgi:hypothetical protein